MRLREVACSGDGSSQRGVAWPALLTLCRVFDRELSQLLDTVLDGEAVADRDTAERLIRAGGASVHLHGQRPVDARGQCASCRLPQRWWSWRRSVCSVHAAVGYFLQQPSHSAMVVLADLDVEGARP